MSLSKSASVKSISLATACAALLACAASPASANGTMGQTYPSGATGQTYPSGATGQTYPSGATGQTYPSGATGQTYPSGATGQTYPNGATGQKYPNGATNQTYPSGATGRHYRNLGRGQTIGFGQPFQPPVYNSGVGRMTAPGLGCQIFATTFWADRAAGFYQNARMDRHFYKMCMGIPD